MAKNCGEEVYEQFVAAGHRPLLRYATIQDLKRLETEADLRAYCEPHAQVPIADDATPFQMLEAVVMYGPPQSDAVIVGRTALLGSAYGAILALMLMVSLCGIPIGRIIARTGVDFDRLATRHLGPLRLLAVVSLASALPFLFRATRSETLLWPPIFAGAISGLLFSRADRTWADGLLISVIGFGLAVVFAFAFQDDSIELVDSLVPAVLTFLALGTGYGCNRSWADAFTKQSWKMGT